MVNDSRRNFLKAGAGAAGLCLIGSSPFTKALYADFPEPSSVNLEAFPLSSVRLASGIFAEQEEINARYLDSLAVVIHGGDTVPHHLPSPHPLPKPAANASMMC